MVWYRALKFITRLEYEYALRSLWINFVSMSHLSIVRWWFANYVRPFFLGFKRCVIILKFGSTVSWGLTRETRLAKYKPIAWCMRLLDCVKCSTIDSDPFTQWSLSSEKKVLHGRIVVCLWQEQLGYLTNYIIH